MLSACARAQVAVEGAFSQMEKLSSKRRRGRLSGRTAASEMMLVGNPDVVLERVVPALLVPKKARVGARAVQAEALVGQCTTTGASLGAPVREANL